MAGKLQDDRTMKFPDVRYVPDKHDFLAALAADHRVLHIGCADGRADLDTKLVAGRLLHARLAEEAIELWGCDFDEPALERLRSRCRFEHLVVADAQDLRPEDFGNSRFDLI